MFGMVAFSAFCEVNLPALITTTTAAAAAAAATTTTTTTTTTATATATTTVIVVAIIIIGFLIGNFSFNHPTVLKWNQFELFSHDMFPVLY